MWLFELLAKLVSFRSDLPVYGGIEGRLCGITSIDIEHDIIVITCAIHNERRMTVGDIRKMLGEFQDREVFFTEHVMLIRVHDACLESSGVVIGD